MSVRPLKLTRAPGNEACWINPNQVTFWTKMPEGWTRICFVGDGTLDVYEDAEKIRDALFHSQLKIED